jgi:predicted RNA-binding protein with PIN domain
MEVFKALVKKRFGLNIEFGEGNVVYKETIKSTVNCAGHFEPLRHYAEVHLRMEPLVRGKGIEVHSEVGVDSLALNYQRLIGTHLTEREFVGVLTGAPLTDVSFTIIGGRAHLKHTEGGDFREAVYRAVRQGLMKAESVLLEPYYSFDIELPSQKLGKVMNDFQSMGAEINPPVTVGENASLTGRIAVSELKRYQLSLMAYLGEAGSLSLSNAGYDICNLQEHVVAEIGYDPDTDVKNPSSSVFCSHGSSDIIPWDEADSHMHVQPDKKDEEEFSDYNLRSIDKNIRREQVTLTELEEIFAKTFSSNKKRTGYKYKRAFNTSKTYSGSSHTYNDKEDYEKIHKKTLKGGKDVLLVDGYNVIFAWDELKELANVNMDGARSKLCDLLTNYAAYKDCEVVLVFDAYKVRGSKGEINKYQNIYIVYTKQAQTADEYIAKTAIEKGKVDRVTVASSDSLVQLIIRGNNCFAMSSLELKQALDNCGVE